MRIYYVSNMMPSERKHDNYGVFCKKVYDGLKCEEIEIPFLSSIKGKSFNKFFNLIRYAILIFDIWIKIIFRNNNFDVVYFQYVWLHVFTSVPLFSLLKHKGKKIVINFHGEDMVAFVENPQKKLFSKILKSSDLIIFPSEYYKNWLCSKFEISASKLFVSASGGIDSSIFKQTGKSEFGNTIVFCSRFTEYKGWRDFIDAVFILHTKGVPFNSIMIGYGEDSDLVNKKVVELGLSELVTVKTRLSHKQIAEIYRNADLFLFTTTAIESLGLVALEAMSCGIPVIGTKIAALPEYIHDGKNGYLVDCHSPEQIAEKVELYFSLSNLEKERFAKSALKTATKYETKIVICTLRKELLSLFTTKR